MEFSAKQIADILHGKIEGNENTLVDNFSKIEEGKPGTLTFLGNPKYGCYIYETQASVALVNEDFIPEKELPPSLTLIRVQDAYAALSVLFNLVEQSKPKKKGIDPLSFISSTAKLKPEEIYVGAFAYIGENVGIGKNVAIYPQVYIGDNVNIGDDTIIYAGVKIYDGCRIGKRCILHSGAVIGADGFGFAKEGDTYKKIPQLGNVVIEDDVEIGANATIDRAALESTIIRKGVKLDNLVHIAHNVEIGENTALAGQVGIAGSVKIGKNCVFGGQAGVGGHIKIEDNVSVGAQAGIISNIKTGRNIMGSPVTDLQTFLRSSVIFPKLPEMYRTLNQLQKEVNELKNELNNKKS
jgi:UDP-3-O-[3-hydroxymyristoyl] glucosamine N-acyltransferase